MTNKIRDENRDPITGAPGAHPVGTGIGAAAGGVAAGAAAGTVAAGPIGALAAYWTSMRWLVAKESGDDEES